MVQRPLHGRPVHSSGMMTFCMPFQKWDIVTIMSVCGRVGGDFMDVKGGDGLVILPMFLAAQPPRLSLLLWTWQGSSALFSTRFYFDLGQNPGVSACFRRVPMESRQPGMMLADVYFASPRLPTSCCMCFFFLSIPPFFISSHHFQ